MVIFVRKKWSSGLAVLTLKYTATILGLLMPCGYANKSWEYKVFIFGLYVSENDVVFLCSFRT